MRGLDARPETGVAKGDRRRLPRRLLAVPPMFGLVAVALGKDNNVDLMHYHYYLAHAWLEGRFGHDLFPAGFHTFFNPLIELPFYWANQAMPAIVLAFLLGAVQGLGVILLWLLASAVLSPPTATGSGGGAESRLAARLAALAGRPGVLPAAVALAGLFSGGSLHVAGTTYYDALVADFTACRPIAATLGRPLSLCPIVRAGEIPGRDQAMPRGAHPPGQVVQRPGF